MKRKNKTSPVERTLRRKFIGTSMIAITIVFLILTAGINLIHMETTLRGEDVLLDMIADGGGRMPSVRRMPPSPKPSESGGQDESARPGETAQSGEAARPGETARSGETARPDNNDYIIADDYNSTLRGRFFRISEETPFETRFFTVKTSTDGSIVTKLDSIASVTEEEAVSYMEQAERKGTQRGTIGSFRFLRSAGSDSGEVLYIFLSMNRQQQTARSLLLTSVLTALGALILTYILVCLFSGKAVEPTIRTIENQKRFITDASHEMKTPITAITAFANVLAMDTPGNEWIEGILKESARLSGLVSELTELSRWDEGSDSLSDSLQKESFSLSEAAWDIIEPYMGRAKSSGRELHTDIAEGINMRGDISAIQRVISVLLDNAIKYSPGGTPISLSISRRGKEAQIVTENSVAADCRPDLTRIFERFYRADPSRSRESGGSGIGLSIARAIVEAHKGTIAAEYTSDERLRIVVTLEAGDAVLPSSD